MRFHGSGSSRRPSLGQRIMWIHHLTVVQYMRMMHPTTVPGVISTVRRAGRHRAIPHLTVHALDGSLSQTWRHLLGAKSRQAASSLLQARHCDLHQQLRPGHLGQDVSAHVDHYQPRTQLPLSFCMYKGCLSLCNSEPAFWQEFWADSRGRMLV